MLWSPIGKLQSPTPANKKDKRNMVTGEDSKIGSTSTGDKQNCTQMAYKEDDKNVDVVSKTVSSNSELNDLIAFPKENVHWPSVWKILKTSGWMRQSSVGLEVRKSESAFFAPWATRTASNPLLSSSSSFKSALNHLREGKDYFYETADVIEYLKLFGDVYDERGLTEKEPKRRRGDPQGSISQPKKVKFLSKSAVPDSKRGQCIIGTAASIHVPGNEHEYHGADRDKAGKIVGIVDAESDTDVEDNSNYAHSILPTSAPSTSSSSTTSATTIYSSSDSLNAFKGKEPSDKTPCENTLGGSAIPTPHRTCTPQAAKVPKPLKPAAPDKTKGRGRDILTHSASKREKAEDLVKGKEEPKVLDTLINLKMLPASNHHNQMLMEDTKGTKRSSSRASKVRAFQTSDEENITTEKDKRNKRKKYALSSAKRAHDEVAVAIDVDSHLSDDIADRSPSENTPSIDVPLQNSNINKATPTSSSVSTGKKNSRANPANSRTRNKSNLSRQLSWGANTTAGEADTSTLRQARTRTNIYAKRDYFLGSSWPTRSQSASSGSWSIK